MEENKITTKEAMFEDSDIPAGIIKDQNGRYSWVYEMPMLKSFFLLTEVWKVLGIAFLLTLFISMLFQIISGGNVADIFSSFLVFALVLLIMMIISIPAYYIVTKANNGMYTVLFEMDDKGIEHTQIKSDKARALEALTILAGSAARNRTTMGAGVLAAAGGSLYSSFAGVRKISAYPNKHLIRIESLLKSNQVYVDENDFAFVFEYIVDHCPEAIVNER